MDTSRHGICYAYGGHAQQAQNNTDTSTGTSSPRQSRVSTENHGALSEYGQDWCDARPQALPFRQKGQGHESKTSAHGGIGERSIGEGSKRSDEQMETSLRPDGGRQ